MKTTINTILFILLHIIGHAQAWPYVHNGYGRNILMGRGYNFMVLEDTIKPAYHRRIFNSQFPLSSTNAIKHIHTGGQSCISDSNGKVLFIHSGLTIYDTMGNIMQNGDWLVDTILYNSRPNYDYSPEWVQGSIILPKGNNQYDLFNVSLSDEIHKHCIDTGGFYYPRGANQIYHHIVDMNANAGKGAVTLKKHNIQLNKNQAMTMYGMTAIRHANGVDWWLIKQSLGDNRGLNESFYFTDEDSSIHNDINEIVGPGFDSIYLLTYLVKHDTIIGPNKYFLGAPKDGNSGYLRGQIATSLDGSKISLVGIHSLSTFNCDFNRCYGTLSNYNFVKLPGDSTGNVYINSTDTFGISGYQYGVTGTAFSPNKRFIYYCKRANVYQYDTWATDSATAWYKVVQGFDTTANTYSDIMYQLVTGINGKIYLSYLNCFGYSIIENPDLKGIACGYNHIGLPTSTASHPGARYASANSNYPNYNLGPAPYVCWPDGISSNNNTLKTPWELYPNPSNGSVRITLPDQAPSNTGWQLYSVTGSLIQSGKLQNGTQTYINLTHLSVGVYYITCLGSSKKLVLQ